MLMLCWPGPIDGLLVVDGAVGPGEAVLHPFRSPDGYTDGHLRFHGETVVAGINWLVLAPPHAGKQLRKVSLNALNGRI